MTQSDDKTVRVWNADGSGTPLIFNGHMGRVVSAAWSSDGTRILSASEDGTARVWLYRDNATTQQALRERTTDCLGIELRQTYLAEDEAKARAAHDACERAHDRTP